MASFPKSEDLFEDSKATSRTTASEFLGRSAGAGTHYRYPQNLGLPPVDKWILFEARRGRHVLRNTVVAETGETDRTLASVGLYLSETALSSHTQTEWNKTDLGFLAEFAAQSGKSFSDLLINPSEASLQKIGAALGGKLGEAVAALKGIASGGVKDAVKSIGAAVSEFGKLGAQAAAADIFGAGDDVLRQPKGTIASLTGVRPNPRTDMMFGCQLYREHQLTYTLIPRNEQEARAIDRIVHFFQFYMLPRYGKSQTLAGAQVGNFLIGFPYEFEISMFDGQANELLHINRIGRSVLIDCKVNHAAGGKTAFVKQGGEFYPVATKLELDFREVKLLARDSAEINRTGVDQKSLDEGSRVL
jgi:hypothetical protein